VRDRIDQSYYHFSIVGQGEALDVGDCMAQGL
jgi:hypothetical protein